MEFNLKNKNCLDYEIPQKKNNNNIKVFYFKYKFIE